MTYTNELEVTVDFSDVDPNLLKDEDTETLVPTVQSSSPTETNSDSTNDSSDSNLVNSGSKSENTGKTSRFFRTKK